MNDNVKIAAGAALTVTAIVLSIAEYREIRRKERETRAKIANETGKQLLAMHLASNRVVERIREGKYDNGGIDAAMNDFKFETIITRVTMED